MRCAATRINQHSWLFGLQLRQYDLATAERICSAANVILKVRFYVPPEFVSPCGYRLLPAKSGH